MEDAYPTFQACVPHRMTVRTKADNFTWSEVCMKSFEKLKLILISEPILEPFCLEKHSVLNVDASLRAI